MEVDAIAREAIRLDTGGSGAEALATLEAAADRFARTEPSAAARLLVDAVEIALGLGGPTRAVAMAERAVAQGAIEGGVEHLRAIVRLGDALSWAGRYNDATNEWRRAARELPHRDPRMLSERANALLRLGDGNAHPEAYRALVAARAAGDNALIADALNLTTAAEVQAGRLLEALGNAEEAHRLFAGADTLDESNAIGLVAWVVALLGDATRAVALFEDAGRINRGLRVSSIGGLARGLLALSTGASVEAADAFAARLATSRMGFVAAMTGIRPYGADLVEAYARAGRSESAREAIAAMLPVAIGSGQPRLMAPLYRAAGIVEGSVEPFRRSLEQHERWGNRYEQARTRLAFGEILRRLRQRADAREQLAAAASAFEQLGVGSWRDRAIAELRLAGARIPQPAVTPVQGPESLTRQEAEVLDLVRAGLSNREIAERLVLSVKTIERHLTTIYGKFGVTSRTQVVAALARAERADAGS